MQSSPPYGHSLRRLCRLSRIVQYELMHWSPCQGFRNDNIGYLENRRLTKIRAIPVPGRMRSKLFPQTVKLVTRNIKNIKNIRMVPRHRKKFKLEKAISLLSFQIFDFSKPKLSYHSNNVFIANYFVMSIKCVLSDLKMAQIACSSH